MKRMIINARAIEHHKTYCRGLSRSMQWLVLILALVCQSCTTVQRLTSSVLTKPPLPFVIPPTGIVVANAYDVDHVRDKKETEFNRLIDLTVLDMSNEISRRTSIPSSFVPGIAMASVPDQHHDQSSPDRWGNMTLSSVTRSRAFPSCGSDSSAQALMMNHAASHAIIINSFNAFFEQTRVDVTKVEGGKNREAFYDIIVEVGYSLRSVSGMHFDTLISLRRFHSSRQVISGFLAAGPGIVANKKDVENGIHSVTDAYLKLFFAAKENRNRVIYTAGNFQGVGEAMKNEGPQKAFEVSEKLIASADTKISATASYNCAVLLENLGRYDEVKHYLDLSLRTFPLSNAQNMMKDY
jgi:hypothetical protein